MTPHLIKAPFDLYHQTLGTCIKELVETSYSIYMFVLNESKRRGPISLVCGGQSPAYFALSMINFHLYNRDAVEIIVIPHSKNGLKGDIHTENIEYKKKLVSWNINLRKNVFILDTIHTGIGINSLASALYYSFPYIVLNKIALNYPESHPEMPVIRVFEAYCVPRVSDSFPRIVPRCPPSLFSSEEINDGFIDIENNPYAEMIVDISYKYNTIPIEDTQWFKLNDQEKN
jgi:hypothetical protein